MLKKLNTQLSLVALLAMSASVSQAADVDIPSLNPDEGRMGEVRRVADDSEFKVCAAPENLSLIHI